MKTTQFLAENRGFGSWIRGIDGFYFYWDFAYFKLEHGVLAFFFLREKAGGVKLDI